MTTAPHANARRAMRAAELLRIAAVAGALLSLAMLLLGCGGGDPDDEPDQPTPQVNCALQPVVCK